MAIIDIVNRIFREFKRYTGDGLPGEPTGAPLPVGDPQSGPYSPKKSELRAAFAEIFGAGEEASEDMLSRYLGAFADDAAASAAADATEAGAETVGQMYFNTTDGKFRVWNGAAWQDQSVAVADGSITGAKLAAGAVTDPKVADSFKSKIVGVAANRAALAAMNGTAHIAVDLMESGRKGLFYWDGSDLSGTLLGPAITPTTVDAGTDTVSMRSATSTSVDAGTDIITANAHGFVADQEVTVTATVDGLVTGKQYFIFNPTANTFQLRTSLTGGAVDLTATTNVTVVTPHGLFTGQPVVVTAAVNGLTLNAVYYAIRITVSTFRLASSFANAIDEVAFNLTSTTNFAVKRHYDPLQIVHVTPAADISGAGGAWVRQAIGDVHAIWAGLTPSGAAKDSIHAINMAVILADRLGCGVALPGFEFSVYAGPNGGIAVLNNTHIIGEGKRKTVLSPTGGATISQLVNYQSGSIIRRHFDKNAANVRVEQVLIEHLAIVLNHPINAITTTGMQVGVDMRNLTRSILRGCWVGNYHPTVSGEKGGSRAFMVQGYGVVCGNVSANDVAYCGGEVNTIEQCFIPGALRNVTIDDNLLSPLSAAYSTRVIGNDIQVGHGLLTQASQYGAANVFKDNVLQACYHPSGNGNPTYGISIVGYGNIVDEPYGEYGAECQFILSLAATAKRNRIRYSGVCTVSGGLTTAFADNSSANQYNIIEYFANVAGTAGQHLSDGPPQRMVNKVNTTVT